MFDMLQHIAAFTQLAWYRYGVCDSSSGIDYHSIIGHIALVIITGSTKLIPCHFVQPMQLI